VVSLHCPDHQLAMKPLRDTHLRFRELPAGCGAVQKSPFPVRKSLI
jgi:hypothetical protein